jgi:hypothetical protein
MADLEPEEIPAENNPFSRRFPTELEQQMLRRLREMVIENEVAAGGDPRNLRFRGDAKQLKLVYWRRKGRRIIDFDDEPWPFELVSEIMES